MIRLPRLRELRLRHLLTQQDLAERAGVARATIARLEAGGSFPYPATVRKLAEALGVHPEDLAEVDIPVRAR